MEGFVAVPNSLLELLGQGELDATDVLLLSVIVNLSKQTGFCWALNASIGKMLGLGKDSIKRRIANLSSDGFLESVVDRGAENSNRRKLKPTEKTRLLFESQGANAPRVRAQTPRGSGRKCPGGQGVNAPGVGAQTPHIKENIKENKTASGGGLHAPARSGGREEEPQSRFTLTTGEDGIPKYVMNS